MKIGYLLQSGAPEIRQPPFSGPAHHVRQVFNALQERGHQIHLIAQYDGEIWQTADLETFTPVYLPALDRSAQQTIERGLRHIQSAFHLPYLAYFESQRIRQACSRVFAGYDLIYERVGWFGYGGGLVAKKLGIPLVLEINGDLLNELDLLGMAPRGMQRWVSTRLFKRNVERASGFVAAGEGWCSKFAAQWGVPETGITVIENGSEVIHLLKRDQLSCFQHDGEFPNKVSLAFVGGFDPWQGVEVLIHAVSQALSQGAHVRLDLIGGGKESGRIRQAAREAGLDGAVTFHGWLPMQETARLLAAAQIGVAPYCGRAEYSGLKLYDYKSAGLAVIASGKDGEPRAIRHGETGWIVPPGDPAALSEAILRLSSNPALRRKLGQNARLDAEQNHTWQETARRLEEVFSQVIHEFN